MKSLLFVLYRAPKPYLELTKELTQVTEGKPEQEKTEY